MDQQKSKITRQIRRIARQQLGFEKLHPGQETALHHVLAGRDTLAVMPTGAGKSAIYQIAAVQLPGPTVVISPLIALQKDQVESINQELEVGVAAAINSTLSQGARADALGGLQENIVEFLFLAPEQFQNEEIIEELKQAKPSLFVIDEAHCVSEWGYDFRPDYLRLGAAIEALGHPTILALTATAAPTVREEIVQRLGMHEPAIVVQGFDRPNIWLGVRIFGDEEAKRRACLQEVVEVEKPGLLYTATRKHAEEMTSDLCQQEVNAAFYHAGMKASERDSIHAAFMAGEIDVVVATTAFGMGIDKRDVRFVFHYDIPGSLDSYYQEIGRCGRDGEPARALLFYRPEDLGLQRFFAGGGQIEPDQIEQVLQTIQAKSGAITLDALQKEVDLSQTKLTTALSRLEAIGIIEIQVNGEITLLEMPDDSAEASLQAAEAQQRHQRLQKSRIEMMRAYAEVHDCRREFLLNYFGEAYTPPCGNCDNCEAGRIQEPEESHPFPLNSPVVHSEWGEGLVMRYEGDKITVLFDEVGYKTLALDVVLENALLMPKP
jgi:ATP-dependent DNA helicase RecQ